MSKKTGNLLHALEHHARDKKEIVFALVVIFATDLNAKGWKIEPVRRKGGGVGSWMLFNTALGKVFYITSAGKGRLFVRDNYLWRHASPVVVLSSRVEALRWAESL